MRRPQLLQPVLAAAMMTSVVAQDQRFTVAIARPDGALVPFAAYNAGRWERAWPDANESMDIKSLDAVPSVWSRRGASVPKLWHVWPASGGAPIQAQVNGIAVVDAHCTGQVALTTNLPKIKAEHPLKFGVAVDVSSVAMRAIEEVRGSDSLWATAERAVQSSFSRLEAIQATKDAKTIPRETPDPVIQITAMYREAKSARSPLHFVAEKKYRTPRFLQDPQCGALTIMTGWLGQTNASTFTLIDSNIYVSDCDATNARRARPLAVFRVSDQLFWVLQEHGYEDETYLIVEIDESKVRFQIDVSAGGC
jgi:hypothetical protein